MEEQNSKNPWLGLESYQEGEVLYGRDDDIRALTQSVLNDKDTLLYGKSGIGKSSILNAGIIPAARRHGYLPVLVRFSHKEKHAYLDQIKEAIANAMIPIPLDEYGNQVTLSDKERQERASELEKRIRKVVDSKDADKESIYEFFHRHTFHDAEGHRIKLLIIFDQFEEIFTLQSDESSKKQFFAELADFLNDVMPSTLLHKAAVQSDAQELVDVTDSTNLDDLFKELDLSVDNGLPEYVTDNDIHLVFTIREDFLSEFEYYSASIPSLKQNRYGLRPINEEQAAQIILRPRPGLISEPVARLIIEKVTGRTDFKLDGIPEIEVDSAVLSLYLNRLYNAKTANTITSELIEKKGKEIIADFYNEAISGISERSIEYLEGMLLNGQDRRDNITIFDAINDGGVTEEELDILCNKKKILRQFNYAGDMRIEYVHDILCPVVKAHKEERLLAKQQEEERRKQEEEKQRILLEEKAKREKIEREAEEELARIAAEAQRAKKKRIIRTTVMFLLVAACIVGLLSIAKSFFDEAEEEKKKNDYLKQQISKFNVNISLTEDVAVKSLWWEANLKVIAKKGERDTIILDRDIDKTKADSTIILPVESSGYETITAVLSYPQLKNFHKEDIPLSIDHLIKYPTIVLPVRLTDPIKYQGRLVFKDGQTECNVQNAIVILNNVVDFTDAKGQFQFLLQDSMSMGDEMMIIKKGYDVKYESAKKYQTELESQEFQTIALTLKDSTNYYSLKDSCKHKGKTPQDSIWSFKTKQPIRYTGLKSGTPDDEITMFFKEEGNRLRGLYYYKGDYNKRKEYSYHFFEGRMSDYEKDPTDKQKYRTFVIESKDIANNEETIKGTIKGQKPASGEWSFKVFMHSRQMAESAQSQKKK